MSDRIRVGDVMTRNFTYLHPDDSLLKCSKTMIKERVGSIILKEGDKLKGVISMKDIVWALYKKKCKNLENVKAKDIATKKIITIKPEASLDQALEKMNKKKVMRLPVITNKKIIGYITIRDMLKIRPSLYESLQEFESIREEADKIQRSRASMEEDFVEAPCEGCGNFDILEKIEGKMLCESCRDTM